MTTSWERRSDIEVLLPKGFKLQDTGAPRGERNYWQIKDANGRVVIGSFSLCTLLSFAKRMYK